jgi:iron complex outermembrane receptor protein
MDLEYQVGRFKIGTTGTYNSFMNKIDPVFNNFIPGLSDYRLKNNKGKFIIDARLVYDLKHSNSVGLVVRNLLNTEYSFRPGIMEAPTSITFQYSHKF